MMFTVYSIDFDAGLVFCESEDDTRHTFGMIDVELLQFTEVKDEHDDDIYDGDIVRFFDGELSKVIREEDGRWVIEVTWEDLPSGADDVTVVGNIYQHKDMLG